jgi:hypothetical protein
MGRAETAIVGHSFGGRPLIEGCVRSLLLLFVYLADFRPGG